ncbi:porin [uncultured Prevotella sp.]|uniref:porin n=1 Tax=uncultured Prevotella sp. TaxID=159272 RepID=UPI00260F5338|nr:porin [uncultured Prevotella sp.]
MKKLISAVLLGACVLAADAQDELVRLKMQTRFDYQREYVDGAAVHDNSGFRGKYFMLLLDGKINDHFSYAYRQRLNKANSEQSFFDATDWAYLKYQPDCHWSFSVGKEPVAVGGYEYDANPVDVYYASEYWNNIPCFQLGATVAYATRSGNDKIAAQCSQSPFVAHASDMYAYSLMWYGTHGCLSTLYSANIVEYMPGRYISYLSLGHRFSLGNITVEADFMNRASSGHTYFFADCSAVVNVAYSPSDRINVFGKVTYDVNSTTKMADYCVMPGTEITQVGGGVEYRPHKSVRLHAAYSRCFGTNTNESGTLKPGRDWMDIGFTWDINLLKLKNPWRKDND